MEMSKLEDLRAADPVTEQNMRGQTNMFEVMSISGIVHSKCEMLHAVLFDQE